MTCLPLGLPIAWSSKTLLTWPELPPGRTRARTGRGLLAGSSRARTGRQGLAEVKLSLQDRDWAILHSLDQLHFLTTRQVERLHYPPGVFTPLSGARTSRRDLARLHDLHLIRHLERRIGGLRAGSASFVWSLDSLGARLLDHPTRRRAQEPSGLHLDHVLAVAELVVRLHEVARTGEVELLEVQGEPACWRIIPAAHGGRLTLKPDLRLTLGVGDQELHWFVEMDRGSEHRPVLTRKCSTFLAAWRQGQEQASSGVFPRVLWVVPDQARQAAVTRVIEGLTSAPAGMFLTATEDQALAVLLGEGGRS